MKKRTLIFGASGNIGGYLLQELLNDTNYDQVIAVVRNELKINHPKLKLIQADFYSLPQVKDQLIADDVFVIIGSPDKNIDRDYPILAAALTKANKATSILVVTAVGANPKSSLAYTKIKGEIESNITALNFDYCYFFRPGMILGERTIYRPMEKFMMGLWKIIDPLFFGKLKKYKGMEAKDIARAMHKAAFIKEDMVTVYHWQNMYQLL